MTDFVGNLRARGVIPHIAVNGTVSKRGMVRKTAIAAATRGTEGYASSQRCRKRTEEPRVFTRTNGGHALHRLNQGRSRLRSGRSSRQARRGRHLHPRRRRLQSDPYPEPAGQTRHLNQTTKDSTATTRSNGPNPQTRNRQITRQNPKPERTATSSAAVRARAARQMQIRASPPQAFHLLRKSRTPVWPHRTNQLRVLAMRCSLRVPPWPDGPLPAGL